MKAALLPVLAADRLAPSRKTLEFRASGRPLIHLWPTRQVFLMPHVHPLRVVAEQLIERMLPWGVLTQLHRDLIRTNLQLITVVEAYRNMALKRQVVAIDVGFTAAVDHAEPPFDDADIAMVGAYAVVAIFQAPVHSGTADAAALWAKPVKGQIPVQQLRRIVDNQGQLHARPRIRTTAG